MNSIQTYIIWIYAFISLVVFIKGFYEVAKKHNPFGESFVLFLMGVFVWGDALVLGLFWFLVSLFVLVLKDWILFLLIFSVFWVVRSLGEVIYWFSHQFSTVVRNPPETLLGYRLFKNDSIWFVYQIIWQCILTISLVATIFLARLWNLN